MISRPCGPGAQSRASQKTNLRLRRQSDIATNVITSGIGLSGFLRIRRTRWRASSSWARWQTARAVATASCWRRCRSTWRRAKAAVTARAAAPVGALGRLLDVLNHHHHTRS
jgi:hypothetical protein